MGCQNCKKKNDIFTKMMSEMVNLKGIDNPYCKKITKKDSKQCLQSPYRKITKFQYVALSRFFSNTGNTAGGG